MPLPNANVPFSFNHVDQPDALGRHVGDPTLVKQYLDSRAVENRDLIKGIIAQLQSVLDGDSGADSISATAIQGLTGATVQALMESLVTVLKMVTDGSSGADFIGATAIDGLTGATVQTLLEALKAFIDTHKSSTDHDGRYFTETELANGALDSRYRTGTELAASGGAGMIGITPPSGITGSTVQQVANGLKNAIDQTALGQIPDGSLTTAKFADASVTGAKLALDVLSMINTSSQQARELLYASNDLPWGGITRTPTYDPVTDDITQSDEVIVATGKLLRRMTYGYTGEDLTTINIKAYDDDGVTVIGEVTDTLSYNAEGDWNGTTRVVIV